MAEDIFSTLKDILKSYEPDFHVKRDEADNYYLETVKADGTPEMVQVRVGASDGTSTEVSGPVKEGDVVVVGERARE